MKNKTCSSCKKLLPVNCFYSAKKHRSGDGYQYECKKCTSTRLCEWRQKDFKKNPEKWRLKYKNWRDKNIDRARELQRNKRHKLKLDVLKSYGGEKPECACCGENQIEFLTIDHKNNDGAEQRRNLGGTNGVYVWLRKNKYPKGFQVLCYNCNCSKGYLGYCPHGKNTKRNTE